MSTRKVKLYLSAVDSKRKIEAVKSIKELTNLGLKEAKDVVDLIAAGTPYMIKGLEDSGDTKVHRKNIMNNSIFTAKTFYDTTPVTVETSARVLDLSKISKLIGAAKPVVESEYMTLNKYFKVKTGIYKVLERNIQKGVSTLLLGPTGVGKTELVSNLAKKLDLPLTIFDMGTMSDPIMSLVGTHAIKVRDGHTTSEFIRSRFSEVIQKPGIVLLDELSRASATANNLLFPCLDFRKTLSMEYCFDDCEPVAVHPECVFIATANLGSQYTGTHKLDRALLDRFMLIEIDPLTTQQVKEAITYHAPKLNGAQVDKIVDCYESINKAHDDYTISFNLSIRHLKLVGDLVQDGFTIYDSFYTICKGIGGKDGLKSLESILTGVKK